MLKNIDPRLYLITGIIIFPAFLFTTDLFIRFLFVIIAVVLNIITGRKFRVLPNILLSLGIIIAHIYPPSGKVYYEIGQFYITQGAIFLGLKKSLLLIGSVYISRFSVRKDLVLPGKAGALFYEIFFYFEKLTELHLKFKKNIIEQIDSKLLEIENSPAIKEGAKTKSPSINSKPCFRQILFFAAIVFLFWGLFGYSHINLWRS
ncbi:MAG: hypothetical protein FWC36_09090 [Spirochaetes bacterium]|nr:hypothetical protein [Spirochaetota bacterium]